MAFGSYRFAVGVWTRPAGFIRHGGNATKDLFSLARKKLQNVPVRGFRVQSEKIKNSPSKRSEKGPSEGSKTPKNESKHTGQSDTGTSSSSPLSVWSQATKTGAYAVGFSAVIFGGCALWQQENIRKHHETFWDKGLQKRPQKRSELRNNFNDVWNHLSMVHKVTYGIIGANVLVFLCWKLAKPSTMSKWFTLSTTGNHSITMLTSIFSHKSFIHLYINMYVLSSFCVAWKQLSNSRIGDSNINGHERYLAFYLTAGMCSSLLSIMVKTIGRIPQPSLGASGAIMGLIGYTCEKLPNNLLSIVFLPNWSFSAESAKNFIIAFDTVGLIIGALTAWRYMIFDHAGHLGGMIFGIWYANRGEKLFDKWSKYIMQARSNK